MRPPSMMRAVRIWIWAGFLVGLCNGAAELTNSVFDVVAGQPYTLTWINASGGVTIDLMTGSSSNLVKVMTIVAGSTGTSYTWTPPSSLTSGTYAFRITDSTGSPNFSALFSFQGTSGSSSSASPTPSSTVEPPTSSRSTTSPTSTLSSASSLQSLTSTTSTSNQSGGSSTSTTSDLAATSSNFGGSNGSGSGATQQSLSGGAIAGIVIGAVLALVIGVAAILVCRRRRRKTGGDIPEPDEPQLDGNPVSELGPTPDKGLAEKAVDPVSPSVPELDHDPQVTNIYEMESATPVPRELPSDHVEPAAPSRSNLPAPWDNVSAPPYSELSSDPHTGSPRATSSPAPPTTADAPEVVPQPAEMAVDSRPADQEQLDDLLRRQSQLQQQRNVLLQLQRIQNEEDELQKRIESLRQGGASS